MENQDEKKILQKLMSNIQKYNKIFLILDNKQLKDKLPIIYSLLDKTENKNQPILVLSVLKNPVYFHSLITYRQITEKEAEYLCYLYHMYEFSNRFFLISKETQYGELFNFVDTGLINPEEAWEAFVY